MNKTWLITGTSGGFGRAMVEQLLARGDRVAATTRRLASLDDLATRFGECLWRSELDITDNADIVRVVREAVADLGRIDVVVSNAGYGLFGAAEEVSDEQLVRQLDVNLLGSMRLVRAVLPHLRAHGGGRILQVSSVGGQVAYPTLGVYHASKWGIEGFIEALIPEVAPFGIQATLVEPGGARTDWAGSNAERAQPLSAYEESTVGAMRRRMATAGLQAFRGDPQKIAKAMIACADEPQAPRRLALGSDAYEALHSTLTARLAALEAQQAIAFSTDVDA
ncbi:NAD(P)-dependent dehydrogenase (short-subunit alcohol dehydrogenase family) [Variovorax paradoxus]|uniref:NAD(P)-dependent dehydrogenase (Short-subunit alcohol dehydrogenase family) n=1 Tax=Variovorax paradoxus TaxID=34073 RepID=A0AAW8EP38_VARPD|nr:SDR family oxidoreductase [Variovorax paradoxus]MDP9974823.1 NAD(P)-dependent dehydrogenase (short-subunit alcohol dehydrogenase family) [Variovorax paradoxus]